MNIYMHIYIFAKIYSLFIIIRQENFTLISYQWNYK